MEQLSFLPPPPVKKVHSEIVKLPAHTMPQITAGGVVGLKDAALIADHFLCEIKQPTNDFTLTVLGFEHHHSRKTTKVDVTTVADCLWDPIDIIAACRTSNSHTTMTVNAWCSRSTNPSGLNEIWIAKLLAAAGIKPYQKSAQRLIDRFSKEKVILPPGSPTDTFETIINAYNGRPRPSRWHLTQERLGAPMWHTKYHKSLLLLEFLGLINLQRGPKGGGMETCRIFWLPLAYIKQPTVAAPANTLDDDELHAFDCLAAGLPV